MFGANPWPMGRKQAILLHDPPHTARRCANAVEPKSGPDLSVAFALKGAGFNLGIDMNQQILVAAGADWPASSACLGDIRGGASRRPMTIDRGA
jgi:hypothetical protein